MNIVSLNLAAQFTNLRHSLASWLASVLPQPERVSVIASSQRPTAPVLVQPIIAPPAHPKPQAHCTPINTATSVAQWYASQTHPCTIVAYVNDQTTQITQLIALPGNAIRELFASPSYANTSTEWQRINKHCLRRKNSDLATLFAEQEFCLTHLEDLLAARWEASQNLTKLYDRTMAAFERAFPTEAEIANISLAERQAALVQFKALMRESTEAIKEMALIDDSLIPALQLLGIELPPAQTAPYSSAAPMPT